MARELTDVPNRQNGVDDHRATITTALATRHAVMSAAIDHLQTQARLLGEIAGLAVQTLQSGHKILIAGNGGSAAEAQHFAAELVGRFLRERAPFAALALCTDSAILTSVGNDYGHTEIFSRQVHALGKTQDLLILFSTSGESENLIQAAVAARAIDVGVVALTGPGPSRLERLADLTLRTPGVDTATIQELHTMVTHLLCDIIEAELCADNDRKAIIAGRGAADFTQ